MIQPLAIIDGCGLPSEDQQHLAEVTEIQFDRDAVLPVERGVLTVALIIRSSGDTLLLRKRHKDHTFTLATGRYDFKPHGATTPFAVRMIKRETRTIGTKSGIFVSCLLCIHWIVCVCVHVCLLV